MKPRHRLFVGIACLVTAFASVGVAAGHVAALAVADPVVEGPIGRVGLWGHPWNDQFFEVGSIGYVEEEYFVSGSAKTYTARPTSAAYKTRILV